MKLKALASAVLARNTTPQHTTHKQGGCEGPRATPYATPATGVQHEAVLMARQMAERWQWDADDWRLWMDHLATLTPDDQRQAVKAVYDADNELQAWLDL